MERTFDLITVREIIEPYMSDLIGLDVEKWLYDHDNIAFADDRNLTMFQKSHPGRYFGHYFFSDRGRKAINLSIYCLEQMFDKYEAEVIQGVVDCKNKPSSWMARHLGFKLVDRFQIADKEAQLFLMSKNDFKGIYK